MRVEQMLRKEIETLPPEVAARKDGHNLGIVVEFSDGHFHSILPSDDVVARRLASEMAGACGAANAIKEPTLTAPTATAPESVVFKNRQAIGDILCMTAAVRDFKKTFPATRVGVITTAMHLWDHNPNFDHQFKDEAKVLEVGPGFGTNRSNAWNIHLIDAFRMDFENKLGVRIDKGDVRPDIWMTAAEHQRSPIVEGPYWVIITGGEPGWTAKQYPRWQQVVDLLKDKIKIVQLGVKGHPWPPLDGVVNMIGATQSREAGIRDLFNIFLHAQGSIGLVSMHMHLSAAFGNPCVVVAGAREPAWFTQYFGHQYLHTNGTLSCGLHTACWKCDVHKGCKNHAQNPKGQLLDLPVPKCVDIIEPEEVAAAVMKYYQGGRLQLGKKVPNTFFKNIVQQPKVYSAPKPSDTDEELVQKSGMKWGGGCITDRDWVFMKGVMEKYEVHTVLEFGAGLSTLLLGRYADRVDTFETMPGWIKKISEMTDPTKNILHQWDGTNFGGFSGPNYDLAFVDGPSGGKTREFSTKVASLLANVVIVHDAGREPERRWQTAYLEPEFKMVSKGGHRCHLWVRKELLPAEKEQPTFPITDSEKAACARCDSKTAIMVTTCRGYGGSERSTIQIMKMLQAQGYEMYLAPTGRISGEYNSNIPKDVGIIPWEKLGQTDPDLLVFYTSDTIWNFRQSQYTATMPHIKAARRVMVLNYQLGGAGIVDWTQGWDQYMFLNSTKEAEFRALQPNSQTRVLAPATDLSRFFAAQPSYNGGLRLIRHSSQGDAKHPDYTNALIQEIIQAIPGVEFHFMPARSDCLEHPQVHRYPKNQPPVWEFLAHGNCFFYHLPPAYQDQGPKVICEAMASGLAVIADNRYGAKDRVTPETGWLVDSKEDILTVLREIRDSPSLLEQKGQAARERAKAEFVMERWIEAIMGV